MDGSEEKQWQFQFLSLTMTIHLIDVYSKCTFEFIHSKKKKIMKNILSNQKLAAMER